MFGSVASLCRPATWTKCARLFEKVRECGRRREARASVSQVKAQRLGNGRSRALPTLKAGSLNPLTFLRVPGLFYARLMAF